MAERDVTDPPVLRLLIDTSTWLDLAKSRDGRRLVRPLQRFVEDGHIELLVPQVVLDEFDRNRDSVKKTMTTSLTERIKAFRKELTAYAEMDYRDQELRLFDACPRRSIRGQEHQRIAAPGRERVGRWGATVGLPTNPESKSRAAFDNVQGNGIDALGYCHGIAAHLVGLCEELMALPAVASYIANPSPRDYPVASRDL